MYKGMDGLLNRLLCATSCCFSQNVNSKIIENLGEIGRIKAAFFSRKRNSISSRLLVPKKCSEHPR